ncbi:MAG: hypothetical protein KIT80_04015 [Chitinophagaceae bacterium]|nr:hypothetical protein [Chitinophagaceae bacterium]MCW5926055.1 hypothetical protein [Chitinophagaceae bacterium]
MKTSRRNVLRLMSMSLVAQSLPSFSLGQENIDNPINSAYDCENGGWRVGWPGRVSQYDVVFDSPPIDPLQGIALGNGDVAALIWCEESRIIIALNKSDHWEDADFGAFGNWNKDQEDISTTQRHAGRVIIDLKYPIFSTLFIQYFSGRLSIADGTAKISASSPFGKISAHFFIDRISGTLFFDIEKKYTEDCPIEVMSERFGSRTFSHWYAQINRDAEIGTKGTSVAVDEDGIFLTQQLKDQFFTTGVHVISATLEGQYIREHSRRGVVKIDSQEKKVHLAVTVTNLVATDSVALAKRELQHIRQMSLEEIKQKNDELWKTYWLRSFLDYGDPYLNHLWHLTMYYALCCQGGKYPGRFNNGLWAWNRDVQNWNFYFHWNQQQLYWPLNAAGHHDLIVPYLDFRYTSLEKAKADAQKLFNVDGAFIADVTERRGYNSLNESHNHTPIAEIALDFWRQYCYTGNRTFLLKQVIPVITEAALFFQTLFEKETDGFYHARGGTGYEGWIMLKDGLTELVYADVLFRTALEALQTAGVKHPGAALWKDIADHLAPMPTAQLPANIDPKADGKNVISEGFFKGTVLPANAIAAAGWGIKEQKMLATYQYVPEEKYFGMKLLDGIFPTVPSAPVFPSGKISVATEKQQPALMQLMRTTMLCYGPGITGWDPTPIVMARLGMKEELQKALEVFPARWQIYANGWGHWGLEGEINKDAELFFRTNEVRDTKTGAKFLFPMWPFRHMSMESMSVLATAMNESLMQSCNDLIVIAPATHRNQTAQFTLHASGGFLVSAEIKSGEVLWVEIKSTWGLSCKIKNPWNAANVHIQKKKSRRQQDIIKLSCKTGDRILLLPDGVNPVWDQKVENPAQATEYKIHSSGKAKIGLPRMY